MTQGERMTELDAWLREASLALGVSDTLDSTLLLDVAREVAHGVARPAAPLTSYLMGVAVGRGADPVEVVTLLRGLLDARPPA